MALPAARAELVTYSSPSDDRWHYPFNFSGGFRPQASVFGSFGNPDFDGFNDRDAMFYIAWDTTTLVEPGLEPEAYDVCGVTVIATNQAGATWRPDQTVDEWFTYDVNGDGVINGDGVPRGSPGDRDGESYDQDIGRPIELFGLEFGTSIWSYEQWNQARPYVGAVCEPITQGGECWNDPRSPYPFVFQEGTGVRLHVEDSAKGTQNEDLDVPLCGDPDGICPFTPMPWATGRPIAYRPRNQPVPFDVQFDIDLTLSDEMVRQYFQEQLSGGRVAVAISTLLLVEEQVVDPGYPSFLTKESSETPPRLLIWLVPVIPGDGDGDGILSLEDFGGVVSCLDGPGETPGTGTLEQNTCGCSFDVDRDGDVDLRDVAHFESEYGL
jgi:hypothetical protein